MARRVERTRNGGKWTEAMYWSAVRSGLRNTFRWWGPMQQCLRNAKRGNLYECAMCGQRFKRTEVEIDHITPVGSLRSLQDLAGFVERLTPEDVAAFQVACKPCHLSKTTADTKGRG
jgi:hypothetical protein